jgi:hypothetical protein
MMTDKDIFNQIEKMNLEAKVKMMSKRGYDISTILLQIKNYIISEVMYMFGVNEQFVLQAEEKDKQRYKSFINSNGNKINRVAYSSILNSGIILK